MCCPDVGTSDLASPGLVDLWERAVREGDSWREGLNRGMSAVAEALRRDPASVPDCPLSATTGAERPDAEAWMAARLEARSRVLAVLKERWALYHRDPAPPVALEIFVGEICTAVSRHAEDENFEHLIEAAAALCGPLQGGDERVPGRSPLVA